MLASISEGTTRIKNLLMGEDVLRTIEAFRAMGVRIRLKSQVSPYHSLRSCTGQTGSGMTTDVLVRGVGMRGLKKPARPIYLGNSGTTMRVLPGILAGQDFEITLKGDRSLSKRPMMRIARPLRQMGIKVSGIKCQVSGRDDICPPLKIRGGKVRPIKYKSKIASAQVKSCILMAGLSADGVTSVTEPVKSRDHTEKMFKMFNIKCQVRGVKCQVLGPAKVKSPGMIKIPADISSAAFFIVAGCILPNMKIILKNVGLNPTRIGILDILKRMNAKINLKPRVSGLEPCGDIIVKSSKLKGVTISPKEVVRAIDEVPIIMVAACFAKGTTVIRGVGELRVKETDRVKSMITNLRKMGADITDHMKKEIVIRGGKLLHGARVFSFSDHRTAMSMLIAGLAIKDITTVKGLGCINKSFPEFEKLLRKLV